MMPKKFPLFSILTISSLCQLVPLTAAPEERVASLQGVPIQYEPNRHERELFGYRPKFEPAVVSFDPENRPYIREWFSYDDMTPEIQTLDSDGNWILRDYGKFLPAGVESAFYTGLGDYRVVFDRDGDAYLPIDAAGTPDGAWYLMHSKDRGETWTPYKLPFGPMPGDYGGRTFNGNRLLVEANSQPQLLEHPPVLMGNNETHLLL